MNLRMLKEDFDVTKEGYSLVNYLNLGNKKSLQLLEFRNDISVRMQMINSNRISVADHLEFIENLKTKISGYWALSKNNKIIGSISLTQILGFGDNLVGGNFLNPEYIGSGLGVVINYFTQRLAFDHLECDKFYSVVKTSNESALRLNKFFGGEPADIGHTQLETDFFHFMFTKEQWIDTIKSKTVNLLFR